MKDIIVAIVSNTEFMNAVITAIAALASWGIVKLFTAKPEWKKYEGLLITSVKMAEKIIPCFAGLRECGGAKSFPPSFCTQPSGVT